MNIAFLLRLTTATYCNICMKKKNRHSVKQFLFQMTPTNKVTCKEDDLFAEDEYTNLFD